MANGSVVVVGGTVGLGRELAQAYADEGREVIVTGREQARAGSAASEIGGRARGIGFDLAAPHAIAAALADVGPVDHLVLAAIERDVNKVQEYDIEGALRLVTLKLVGYTEVIHTLVPRLGEDSSILIFGGLAQFTDPLGFTPSPGMVTTYHAPGGLGVRMDSHLYAGYRVPPNYDSLIGKLIVHGEDRPACLMRLRRALGETIVGGIDTTLPLFQRLLQNTDILSGDYNIHWLEQWLAEQPE